MNMSDFPSGRSSRQELQGPRPAPLKVRKDSHKIKKPPVALAPPPASLLHHNHDPPPPPVIIYTISPKVIHANPNEFMSLVQRLTGPNSSYASSSSSMSNSNASSNPGFVFQGSTNAMSPAARFASIEKTKLANSKKTHVHDTMEMEQEVEIGKDFQRTGNFPGILSPNPNALPPIPQNFFSTPSDSNPLSFFYDLSPVLHSNRNCGNFTMPSPSFASPQINMPSPNTLDLFNTLFDL